MMSVQRVDISKKEKRRNNYIKNSVSSLNQKSKSKEKKKGGGKESKFNQMISINDEHARG